MKIIFESREEWDDFDKGTCPSDLGKPYFECNYRCKECYKNAGVTIIKEYKEKENDQIND